VPSAESPSVLFVCTFNSVRSPMAAGLARKLYGPAVHVDSCGLESEGEVDPFAAVVMAEVGVDLSDHAPKRFDDMIARGGFTHVVALSEEAWGAVAPGLGAAAALHWPIQDPTHSDGSRESRLEAYRLIRRRLEEKILEHFGQPSAALR
jgi:protein-tyrosine-phosphatase